MKLLQEVLQQNPNYSRQQKFTFSVRITRQVENLDGYNQFLLAYPYIVEALEVISNILHLEKYPNQHQWVTESRRMASALLAGIRKFSFCIVWATIVRSLFYLRDSTKKIQGYISIQDWQKSLAKVLLSFETTVPRSIFLVALSTQRKWPP